MGVGVAGCGEGGWGGGVRVWGMVWVEVWVWGGVGGLAWVKWCGVVRGGGGM